MSSYRKDEYILKIELFLGGKITQQRDSWVNMFLSELMVVGETIKQLF